MSITETVNTQQILQMGPLAEKLQHTLQHLPATTGQQLRDEQTTVNELKQTEIQDPEESAASNSTDPESKRRREARIRNKSALENDSEESVAGLPIANPADSSSHQGKHVNLTV